MRARSFVLLPFLIAACGGAPTAAESPDPGPPFVDADWRREVIELPAQFAPTMPGGRELLLFAPGMFEDGAEDFWSYIFWMELEEAGLDADRLAAIFQLYYGGVVQAVAGQQGLDLTLEEAASITVTPAGTDVFEMELRIIEPFVTLEPLVVHAVITTVLKRESSTVLHVQASPQPVSHWIWTHLAAAVQAADFR